LPSIGAAAVSLAVEGRPPGVVTGGDRREAARREVEHVEDAARVRAPHPHRAVEEQRLRLVARELHLLDLDALAAASTRSAAAARVVARPVARSTRTRLVPPRCRATSRYERPSLSQVTVGSGALAKSADLKIRSTVIGVAAPPCAAASAGTSAAVARRGYERRSEAERMVSWVESRRES
jgi:hypothetical protein